MLIISYGACDSVASLDIDDCTQNPCQNGGHCRVSFCEAMVASYNVMARQLPV